MWWKCGLKLFLPWCNTSKNLTIWGILHLHKMSWAVTKNLVHLQVSFLRGSSHQMGLFYYSLPHISRLTNSVSKQNLFTGWNTYLWSWINCSDSKTTCVTVLDRGILKPNGMFVAYICISMPRLPFGSTVARWQCCCLRSGGKKTHKSLDSLFNAFDSSFCALENCETGSPSSILHSFIVFNEAIEPAQNPDRQTSRGHFVERQLL